jgi:hypothetical protein
MQSYCGDEDLILTPEDDLNYGGNIYKDDEKELLIAM